MSSAVLKLNPDGSLQVHVGVTDIGTAAKTTMGLLGAEAMEIPFERVSVLSGDTDRAPYSVGESGSRTTNYTGYAVVTAAEDLKRQLRELAAQSWSVAADAVQYSQGAVSMQDRPDRRTVIAEILKGNPDGLIAQATTDPKLKGVSRNSFAAHFVELEVDTETGDIRILKYVAAHDSGRILNPLTAGSQVKGGVAQGVGMALREELLYDQMTGIPLNPGYYGARIVTHGDVPDVEVIFVETADPYGPYGAKSVGEPPIVPSVAAIANAVFNATGIRIKELPITRSKILDAAPGVRLGGGRA
jgi:CO/xanthine dehydrogenase Mo-binding subunit